MLLTDKSNKDMHAIVFRKTANTLRDSVFAQMQYAISKLCLDQYFECTVSPMKITYKPTKQTIFFRGVDDKMKLKSIKAPFGYIGITWLEEADTFSGMEEIRSVLQSTMRGGKKYWVFKSFNPPMSNRNFMNKESKENRDDSITHESDYRTVPQEWLGDAFIDEAEHLKNTNEKAYRHEYLGEAVGLGINIFEFLEIRTITDEEIAQMDRIYQGVDWGFSPDAYAFIRNYYNHNQEKIYLIDENYCYKQRNVTTAQWIIDKGYDDYEIVCDNAENKSISDYHDMGLYAKPVVKGPGSVEYGMKWLQGKTIVIDPARTPKAYKEITEYEHDTDKNGEVIGGYPDKNNHSIDALRYSLTPLFGRRGNIA